MKKMTFRQLPEGYRLFREIRLERDRKAQISMLAVQLAFVAVMILAGVLYCSPAAAVSQGVWKTVARLIAMAAGMFVYTIAHEWVHGVFIRLFSGEAAEFGFRKGMAYASAKAYFSKIPYIIIALAPLVIWGILLGFLSGDAGEETFWYVYGVQIFNVAGAAGDIYISAITLRMPGKVLVQDEGTAMKFFLPEEKEETH